MARFSAITIGGQETTGARGRNINRGAYGVWKDLGGLGPDLKVVLICKGTTGPPIYRGTGSGVNGEGGALQL